MDFGYWPDKYWTGYWTEDYWPLIIVLPPKIYNLRWDIINDYISKLNWDLENGYIAGVYVERRRNDERNFGLIQTLSGAALSAQDLTVDLTQYGYTYRVKAFNENGISDPSNRGVIIFIKQSPSDKRSGLMMTYNYAISGNSIDNFATLKEEWNDSISDLF